MSTTPFISQQDLSDYLGRDVTTDPASLECVDAACDIVRDISEQTFNRGTTTDVFDGSGTDALLLPELPVNSVGTVSYVDTAGSATTLGTTDYTLNDNGVLFATNLSGTSTIGTCWVAGRQNVRVTYDHGYADADIPRSVRMVALTIAARLFVQGPNISEAIGDTNVRYGVNATDLTTGEQALLRQYRRT
jgi:hypothetical protein